MAPAALTNTVQREQNIRTDALAKVGVDMWNTFGEYGFILVYSWGPCYRNLFSLWLIHHFNRSLCYVNC